MSAVLKVSLTVVLLALAVSAGWAFHLKRSAQTTAYCSSCHIIQPYYNSWNSSKFLAHTHQELGLTCQDCHARTTRAAVTEYVRYVTRSYQEPLKDHRVRPEECLRCHGSYAALATRTKNLKRADGMWLGRNPHDSHWGQIDCGICHKMHKPSVDLCAGCHGFPQTGLAWTTTAQTY